MVDGMTQGRGKMVWRCGSHELDLSEKGIIAGILNVTPDSFSDGGRYAMQEAALGRAMEMIEEGATLIDIGGESTRPGAEAVALDEEKRRVLPVIEALANRWNGPISVDTSKAEVAREALSLGASVVNDVSGLRDGEMVRVCAASDCGVVVMHMRGTPKTMQVDPGYEDPVREVTDFFAERLQTLSAAGISPERLCWDPGIGFGKRLEDNAALIRGGRQLSVGDRPIMMGISRKSFIGKLLGETELAARDWPTVGLTAWTRGLGARVHRVHQVKENLDALRMAEALLSSR